MTETREPIKKVALEDVLALYDANLVPGNPTQIDFVVGTPGDGEGLFRFRDELCGVSEYVVHFTPDKVLSVMLVRQGEKCNYHPKNYGAALAKDDVSRWIAAILQKYDGTPEPPRDDGKPVGAVSAGNLGVISPPRDEPEPAVSLQRQPVERVARSRGDFPWLTGLTPAVAGAASLLVAGILLRDQTNARHALGATGAALTGFGANQMVNHFSPDTWWAQEAGPYGSSGVGVATGGLALAISFAFGGPEQPESLGPDIHTEPKPVASGTSSTVGQRGGRGR